MSNPSVIMTGATMPRLKAPGSIVVCCDYQGVPKSGELPKVVKVTRFAGGVDASSSATWALTASNCTATISSNGTITITEFAASGALAVTSTANGVPLTESIETMSSLENPPIQQPSGGTGTQITQASTSTFVLIPASAVSAPGDIIVSPPIWINAPASPKWISISTPLTYQVHSTSTDKTGSASCYMKVQYRDVDNAGAWTDCVTPAGWASLTDSQKTTRRCRLGYGGNAMAPDKDGTMTLNGTIGAGVLPATNKIEFRIVAWREDSDDGMVGPFYIKSGSFTVQWSG